MASIFEKFKTSESSRYGLIVGVVLIVIFAVAVAYWSMQEPYKPVFTNLEARDAANIVSELDKLKVSYKIAEGGSTILVPEEKVHEVRLQLMGMDATLNGGLGFEIFDSSDFGMTEFVQKINYQRALQGELSRTISSLKEVKYARVHLVLAENSLFKQSKNNSSASVTLFLKENHTISRKQIHGIQRLVAASVPSLEINDVTVVSQNGETLSRLADETDDIESASVRLQKQQEVEEYLAKKVEAVLQHVFGNHESIVEVNATLNLDRVKTTKETLLPNPQGVTGVVRKRESRSDHKKNQNTQNVSTEVEYQIGKQIDQTILATGMIERLSVGVIVPENTSSLNIERIREMIAVAVGLDEGRGDSLVVHPFRAAKNAKSSADIFTPERSQAINPVGYESISTTDPGGGNSQIENAKSGDPGSSLLVDNKYFIKAAKLWHEISGRDLMIGDLIIVLVILAVVILITSISLTYRMVKRGKAQQSPGMSKEEREELSAKLAEWLEDSDIKRPAEASL